MTRVPTVSFLFVDQVGSTAQLQALGDERAAPVRRAMFDIIQSALAAHGGIQVDNTGDGVMATFDRAVAAVEGAAAIQHGVRRHNQTRSTAESIEAKAECLPSRARHASCSVLDGSAIQRRPIAAPRTRTPNDEPPSAMSAPDTRVLSARLVADLDVHFAGFRAVGLRA